MSTDLFPKLMNYLSDPDYFERGDLRAALVEALKYHEPGHRHAGVSPWLFGDDHCTYCKEFGRPVAVFMGDINGKQMLTHCHGYTDWCADCDGADDYPCVPVKAICEALAVTW